MKWIVMKYAEILIASGDVQFRRATLESLPLATQRYIEASRVLGSEPSKVPDLGKRKYTAKTFEQLREADIAYDSVSLELGLPFSVQLKSRGAAVVDNTNPMQQNIVCFLKTGYFCIPLNPKFKQMRALVHDRLFNLRNSFDIEGNPVSYALRDPPIDPGELVALSKQGLGVSDVLRLVSGERNGPLPRQRFECLLSRALALCKELRLLGERLVTAIEKKEVESLNAGNAQHSGVIQQMMLDLQLIGLEEAQKTVESLLMDRDSLGEQLNYYLKLIGEPDSKIPKPNEDWEGISQSIDTPSQDELRMSSYEQTEMKYSDSAITNNDVATKLLYLASVLYVIPDVTVNCEPLGVGTTVRDTLINLSYFYDM